MSYSNHPPIIDPSTQRPVVLQGEVACEDEHVGIVAEVEAVADQLFQHTSAQTGSRASIYPGGH